MNDLRQYDKNLIGVINPRSIPLQTRIETGEGKRGTLSNWGSKARERIGMRSFSQAASFARCVVRPLRRFAR